MGLRRFGFGFSAIMMTALIALSPAKVVFAETTAPDNGVGRISDSLLQSMRQRGILKPAPRPIDPVALEVSEAPVATAATVPPQAPVTVAEQQKKKKKIFKPITLGTEQGFEIGLMVSDYKYHEEVNNQPFMNIKGEKLSIDTALTGKISENWFARAEVRFGYGLPEYSGSGVLKNNEDLVWDTRGLIGRDFVFDHAGFSLYTGLGSRYLYSDLRGVSSTGASGYRRKSFYEYIPVGLTSRVRLGDERRLSLNAEYDHFLQGEQQSILGDVNPALDSLDNEQHNAYFAGRGSVLFETEKWAMGPWLHYWHIKDSETNCVPGFCGLEPKNETTEVGFKIVRKLGF